MPSQVQEMLDDLNKVFDGIEEKLDAVLAKQDDSEDDEGDKGSDTRKRVRPKVAKKDDDAEEGDDDVKKAKSKKKGSDAEDAADGGDDEESEDDWSKGKTKKKVAKKDESEDDEDDVKKSKKSDKDVKKAKDESEDDEIEKSDESDDDTIEVDGEVVTKKDLGPAFGIVKALNARVTKAEKSVDDERDLRKRAEFKKRADDLYKHVPGSLDERVQMLMVIDGCEKGVKKAFEQVFQQSEKLASVAFAKIGKQFTAEDGKNIDPKDFDKKVTEIAVAEKCSKSSAMQKARQRHPELFKAMQEAGSQVAGN